MWSQGRFPLDGQSRDDMRSFALAAAGLGFRHVEISYVIPPEGVEEILRADAVAVSSIHSPCPRVRAPDGRLSDALNLAALDEEERGLAVRLAKASADCAAQAGAGLLVVHLGGIGTTMFEEERQLRRLYDSGQRDDEEVERLRKKAAERRREGAAAHFPYARRSLAEIAEHAAKRGVTVGLENRYHYHEFPSPGEMAELLSEYPDHVAGFWLDVGHAEVLDRLGLIPHTQWLTALGSRCVGAHVHDVDGLADHRAPGHGTADWAHYAAHLPPHAPRVFEINQRVPEEQVAAAPAFLREKGLLP